MPLRRAVVSLLALAARAAGARGPAARGAATCYAKRYPDLKRKFCNADARATCARRGALPGARPARGAAVRVRRRNERDRAGARRRRHRRGPVVRAPRDAALGGLTQRESFNDPPYAIDARRLHQTRSWVAYLSILSRFGPRRGRRGVSERAPSLQWREVARTDAVAATASARCRMRVTRLVSERRQCRDRVRRTQASAPRPGMPAWTGAWHRRSRSTSWRAAAGRGRRRLATSAPAAAGTVRTSTK